MVDLGLGLDIVAIFGTLIYMSLLIAENFSPEERAFEEFEYTKRSLINQQVSIR